MKVPVEDINASIVEHGVTPDAQTMSVEKVFWSHFCTNLAPATRFALVWHSGRAHWNVGDGKFNGILAPDMTQTLASGTSSAAVPLAV